MADAQIPTCSKTSTRPKRIRVNILRNPDPPAAAAAAAAAAAETTHYYDANNDVVVVGGDGDAVWDAIERKKAAAQYRLNEVVYAFWEGTGLYYKAKILEIFPSGNVCVQYDTYDLVERLPATDLLKYVRKNNFRNTKGRWKLMGPQQEPVNLTKTVTESKSTVDLTVDDDELVDLTMDES